MMMSFKEKNILCYSLVFVWLATAFASMWELKGQSATLLSLAGVNNPSLVSLLIWGGAGIDALLGLALWLKPTRLTYWAAWVVMLLMTFAATVMLPSLWLHPLGPLTKNVPIAVVLWILIKEPA
jgi:hypothetical protein